MNRQTAIVLFGSIILFCCSMENKQKEAFNDPMNSEIITEDIDNFWRAFSMVDTLNITYNPFNDAYFEIGSPGLNDFLSDKIIHSDSLMKTVIEHRDWYLQLKSHTLESLKMEKKIRSVFYSLAYWYPQAKFPSVYFVIGRFNSGGTSTKNGIIIGMENSGPLQDIPYLIAHETIHFQQQTDSAKTLLEQSIIEGSADFIGELISGGNINEAKYEYGNQNKDRLCKEFVEVMNTTDFTDWLYESSGKDERPADLGYWIGYKITKQYFDKTPDKKQAIYEILNISDYEKFLADSGFLANYLTNEQHTRSE